MDFQNVFADLKHILKKYEKDLVLKGDNEENYCLNTHVHPTKKNEEGFFGAVQVKKNYVSFHLMPVYVYPELLDNISPELRKKMQGKSCFNFKKADADLFRQLESLADSSFKKFSEANLL